MGIERGVIGIDLDQKEQCRVLDILMNVEKLTARLDVEACTGMAQKTIAKIVRDISANFKVSGMKEHHMRVTARRLFLPDIAGAGDRAPPRSQDRRAQQ